MKRRGDAPVRLYADGVFDMFHYGHARALEQAKKSFPNSYLMVGCCNDKDTHKFKGKTVMQDVERYESLRHCKWVDEVIPDAPWVLTEEFLVKHDIDFVCHDALPYEDASGAAEGGDCYASLKKINKFWETKRTEGVSTSDLIIRIVKDYDKFVRRNLARGRSAEEMNVPFVKEKAIKFDLAVQAQKDKVGEWIGRTSATTKELIQSWSEKAEELQFGFLSVFSKNGRLRKTLRKTRQQVRNRINTLAGNTLM